MWLASQDPRPDNYSKLMYGVAFLLVTPFVTGVAMLVNYYEAKHNAKSHYTVTKMSQIAYTFWFSTTLLSAIVGFSIFTAGTSPLSGAVSLFSCIFLVIGWTMAGWPKQGWPLRSLLLLKRIANWQVGAAAAIIALIFKFPKEGQSMTESLGENYGFMMALLIVWVAGATLLTVLLEPLKYKLESMQKGVLQKWEAGEID